MRIVKYRFVKVCLIELQRMWKGLGYTWNITFMISCKLCLFNGSKCLKVGVLDSYCWKSSILKYSNHSETVHGTHGNSHV
jgi:hypothetical protein